MATVTADLTQPRAQGARLPLVTRVAIAIAWPVLLIAWLYEKTAKLGFNVLDEGLMASYGRRILDGQVPHRDFISPRPVMSALIHLPDLILPLPLYLAGRLDGITEVVLFSILVAWLVFRSPPWEWGPIRALAAAASALVNLHTFDETAWYTFDGLFLVAAGLLLVDTGIRRDRRRLVYAGLVLGGLAATTKQSFVPAAGMLLIWVGWHGHGRRLPRSELVRELSVAAGLLALPMALYLAVISALGGLPDALSQLDSGRLVWGRSLFEMVGLIDKPPFGRPLFHGHFPWEVGVATAVLLALRARNAPRWACAGAGVVVTALTLRLPFHQHLAWYASWSLEVMWALILVIAIRAVFERSLDWTALAVLLMGWMAMLSWGYELPALMGGSMCLVVANWALADVRQEMFVVGRRSVLVAVATAAAFGLFLYTADREVSARESQPFYDVPLGRLTASVGDVDPDFRGIKTGQATSDYMHGLQRCLRRYPAKWVAILPDNPGIYPAMGLHSPFPIDWFWKTDMSHQLGRIIDAGVDLNRRGNYLVLFQTASGLFLRTEHHLPDATRRSIPVMISEPILYNAPLAEALINVLHGRRVVCGSFLGIYAR